MRNVWRRYASRSPTITPCWLLFDALRKNCVRSLPPLACTTASSSDPPSKIARAWSNVRVPEATGPPQLPPVSTQSSVVHAAVTPRDPRSNWRCSVGSRFTRSSLYVVRSEYWVWPARPFLVVMRMTPWLARAP
jgi:hypothetical protein